MLNNKSLVFLSLAALVAATCAANMWNIDIDPHIVSGKPAARGEFPYYALVTSFWKDGRKTSCGGTLIKNQWVLTAGHCVSTESVTVDKIEVHLGAFNLTDLTEDGRVIVPIVTVFPHPKYSLSGMENDVALLKLEEPVQFNDYVQALNLTQKLQEPGTNVTAIGFGKLRSSDSTLSPTLQYTELFLITHEICEQTFPALSRREDVICTLGNNREAPCNGDGGGPLVVFENGVPALVGGTSFGHIRGCHVGFPAGFSNTFIFTSWIQETIANN